MLGKIEGPLAVVSPHLDDAVLSLGATIAMVARQGIPVQVITVLAYDPDHDEPSGRWDLKCGFPSAFTAMRARRTEDARACELLGVEPVWLPYADNEHRATADRAAIRSAVRNAVDAAGTVLVPGSPLVHPDHAWVAGLATEEDVIGNRKLGLYVEQPYSADKVLAGHSTKRGRSSLPRRVGHMVKVAVAGQDRTRHRPSLATDLRHGVHQQSWRSIGLTPQDWYAKQRAIAAYRSQLQSLRPFVRSRITLCELGARGEPICWT